MDVDFTRLLAHDRWANGEAMSSIEALPAPPAKAVRILAHLLGAEECWISRVSRGCEPDDIDAWDTMDLPALRRAWRDDLPARWAALLRDPVLSAPTRPFSYVNYLGETHEGVVADAWTNLMLHSSYHRGQVALLVRGAGGQPAATEFHRAVRTGAIAPAVPSRA